MSFPQRLALIVLLVIAGTEIGWIEPISSGLLSRKVQLVDAWFLIIEESSERSPATAMIIGDAALWEEAKSLGIQHRSYDHELPNAASYKPIAAAAGLPAYLFINNGKLLRSGRLPATRDEIRRILRQE